LLHGALVLVATVAMAMMAVAAAATQEIALMRRGGDGV